MGQRKFSRIMFDRYVTLRKGNSALQGEIINISLQGVLLKTTSLFNLRETCTIEFRLADHPAAPVLEIQGKVVRCENDKTAFHFTRMDPDTFLHLKNIMAYNRGDEALVLDELAEVLSNK